MKGRQILRKNDRYCDDDFHDIHAIIRIGYLRIGLLTLVCAHDRTFLVFPIGILYR